MAYGAFFVKIKVELQQVFDVRMQRAVLPVHPLAFAQQLHEKTNLVMPCCSVEKNSASDTSQTFRANK